MNLDMYGGRRLRLLLVLGACVVTLVAIWLYATSVEDWGDAQTVIFTVSPLVLGVVGLGALALLVADLVRERRA